ncbi:hypothetical protein FQA39_LY05357 [Lamprigera yunnana]|nr:hypothetical protein FQA39_LY05357 [Lamprigera yunnana]
MANNTNDPLFNINFVKAIENRPRIWNYNLSEYRKRNKIENAWKEVAEEVKDTEVLMALYEKNLPFKKYLINLVKEVQREPWFLKINPRGEVPVLQDNGKVIPDSVRIIDYLEDNFSNGNTPRLIPTDNLETKQKVLHFKAMIDALPARIITMGSFHHSELVHFPKPPFVGPVRTMLINADRNTVKVLQELAKKNPEIREVLLSKITVHEQKSTMITNQDQYLKVLDQVEQVLAEIENELATHIGEKENWWLCCHEFTIADISFTILLERLDQLGYSNRFLEK